MLEGKKLVVGESDGEVRLDHEGKGYWHKFKKEKVEEKVEEPKPISKMSKKALKSKLKKEAE